MKIAAISDDGNTISQHFGRAPYYMVLTIEDGEIVERDLREKAGHAQFQNETEHHHEEHQHGGQDEGHHGHGHHGDAQGRHGYGAGAQGRHARMAAAITDCQAVLCRGMGWGAYESMKEHGITPIVTDIRDIEEAVRAYLDGSIVDLTDRLH
jgi:predicted Fe-Mo cluster-binding NifX family protein